MSLTRLAIFLTVITALAALIHYFLWARLVRDPQWPAPWPRWGGWFFAGLAVTVPLAMATSRLLAPSLIGPIAWPLLLWLGTLFILLTVLLPLDLSVALVSLARRATNQPIGDPSRRQFLARLVAGAAGLTAFGATVTGVANAIGPVAVKRVQVPLAELPAAFAGFRIVQLTDVHVGPTIGRAFVQDLVERVNALEPDLVAITGDLVDGRVGYLADELLPLADLRTRHGVFFVTGNHEYYSGADEWIAHLQTLGVRVLRNERVTLTRQAARLDVAGIDDWTAHEFGGDHGADLPKAMAGRDPTVPVVLLAHQPRAVFEAARLGVALQVSGHTHGGQIFPFNFLVSLVQPYVAGLHRHGGTMIYVSRGTGYWGPPMRVGQPAEITHLELVPETAG